MLRFIREVGSPKGISLSYQVTLAGERRSIWKVYVTLCPVKGHSYIDPAPSAAHMQRL
jgi:hypothetical protein